MIMSVERDIGPPAVNPVLFEGYHKRVVAVRLRLTRGDQAAIAADLRITNSRVSDVLNCKLYEPDTLTRIEQWAEDGHARTGT